MARKTRVIAVACQKGGVSKTTTVHNLGAGLALLGKKVLMLDMDPQADLTSGCGLDLDDENPLETTMVNCLLDKTPLKDATIVINKKLDIVPCNIDLAEAEMKLLGVMNKDLRLKKILEPVKDIYDFILIDCPPSLGQLTVNAFHAASEVLVPMLPEFRPYRAIPKLLETMELVLEGGANPDLSLTGVVVTRYDSRNKLHPDVVERLRNMVGPKLFKTIVRSNIRLAEAPINGMAIFDYDAKSNGAEDYTALCKELVKKGGA